MRSPIATAIHIGSAYIVQKIMRIVRVAMSVTDRPNGCFVLKFPYDKNLRHIERKGARLAFSDAMGGSPVAHRQICLVAPTTIGGHECGTRVAADLTTRMHKWFR